MNLADTPPPKKFSIDDVVCLDSPDGPVRVVVSLFTVRGQWYYRTRAVDDPDGEVIPTVEENIVRCAGCAAASPRSGVTVVRGS